MTMTRCEKCGNNGEKRFFSGLVLCDHCCEALATEDETTEITIEWTENDGETYVVRMYADSASKSISIRGLRTMGYDQEAMPDDPLGKFWDALDRGVVVESRLCAPANRAGGLVLTAFDIVVSLGAAA